MVLQGGKVVRLEQHPYGLRAVPTPPLCHREGDNPWGTPSMGFLSGLGRQGSARGRDQPMGSRTRSGVRDRSSSVGVLR